MDLDRRLGPEWIAAITITLVTRVALLAVGYAAAWYLADTEGAAQVGSFDRWAQWDARILVGIAEHGYTAEADPHATAFFPLFPLLVGALAVVVRDPVIAGMIVSTAATVVALAFLYRLAEADVGEGAGRRAAWYLALFPTAVFLVAPYTEALFLAGAVPAFYYARRGRWLLVGPPAAIAMATRFAGVCLLVGLAVEFVAQRRFDAERVGRAVAALAVGIAPLLAYAAYLQATRGDPLYFAVDQRIGWGREPTWPWDALMTTWNTWEGADYPTNWIFAWRMEIVAAAAGIGFTIWALVKRWWGYAAYMGSLMAILLASTWYYSIPRMLLSLFPIALLLASATRDRDAWHETLIVLLAPLAALGVVVFTQGAWFY